MSIAERSLMDLLALEDGCRTCGVNRGVWCKIRPGYKGAGTPARALHADRERPVRHARWVGYTEGHLDALNNLAQRIEDPHVGELEIHQIVADLLVQSERWANSAHQAALEDIPEGWHR